MSQIVVMARWPSPGRCKRRLSRDLAQGIGLRQAPERAMRIQRRLTGHTASVVTAIEDELLRPPVLAVSGLGQRGALRWGRQLGISVVRQQGHGNLGCRLKRQLLQSRRDGHSCLMIGTDLPDLCPGDLRQAMDRLESHDLVLGPAEDGGYWLLGVGRSLMQHPEAWPLIGIPWGKTDVLQTTLSAADAAGLSSTTVMLKGDIDHAQDLQRWQG